MVATDDRVSRATDGASIALLRRLRAGAEIPYVHRADVCSAAPADLVANLTPAPGTDQTDDGYTSIWYFYYPKRYKNNQGKTSGHRHRAIDTGDETSWHSEISAKDVRGSEGGTFCTFSYGRSKDGSLERMGWCMVEYDFVDKDKQAAGNTAGSNFVLCKVYRSSRAKGKKPSSSSSKSAALSSSKTARATPLCSKRKKAGSGNAEARPTKKIHIRREQVQVQHDNSEFVQTEYGPMPSQLAHINVDEWIECQEMFLAVEEQGLQQPCAGPEQGGEFIQMSCGLMMPAVAEVTLEDLLGSEIMSGECTGVPAASTPLEDGFFVGVDPVAPVVVPELTVEDLLGIGTEMMSGECISMPTASTPPDDDFFDGIFGAQEDARSRASSSCAPSWSMAPSSSAGCSTPVQEPPLWLPYLLCS